MKKLWSKEWIASTQKRKQRKFVFNAPMHIRQQLNTAALSKELRSEYGTRSLTLRKGDTVKIMAGQFKEKTGKVSRISLSKTRVYVDGAGVRRADGTEALYPIHPSNLKITKLDLSDKRRVDKLKSFKGESKK